MLPVCRWQVRGRVKTKAETLMVSAFVSFRTKSGGSEDTILRPCQSSARTQTHHSDYLGCGSRLYVHPRSFSYVEHFRKVSNALGRMPAQFRFPMHGDLSVAVISVIVRHNCILICWGNIEAVLPLVLIPGLRLRPRYRQARRPPLSHRYSNPFPRPPQSVHRH